MPGYPNEVKKASYSGRFRKTSISVPPWLRVILFCTFLTLVAMRSNPSWTFDPYGWVDQWGYVGQAYFFPELRSAFPNAASGDLLPVVWPSAFFYYLFGDLHANLIRDFLFTVMTSSAIVLTVTRMTRLSVGLVIGSLLFASQYFLTTSGSSYTDSHVAAYFAISIYLLCIAKSKKGRSQLLYIGISGVFFALMVYSAVLSISFVPVLLLFFVLSSQQESRLARKVWIFATCYVVAFVATTFAFQVGYSIYGEGYFYENTIRKLLSFTIGNAYRAPDYSLWLPDASWLIVPAAISAAAAAVTVVFIVRFRFNEVAFPKEIALLSLAPAGLTILIGINVIVKQWSLQYLYFNQSLPIYYLTLGGLVSLAVKKLEGLRYWLVTGLALFILTLSLTNVIDFTYSTLRLALNPVFAENAMAVLFALIALLGISLTFMVFTKKVAPFALVTLVIATAFSVTPAFGCYLCFDGFAQRALPAFASSSEKVFTSTLKLANAITEADPSRTQKVWYSEFSDFGPLFRQANAVTYLNEENNRVSKSFPSLLDEGAPIGSGGSLPVVGDRLLLISEIPDDVDQALGVLTSSGFEAVAEPTTEVRLEGEVPVYITSISILSSRN